MILDVCIIAVLLAVGNVAFRNFEPFMPWWRRVLKSILILTITAAISYFLGRTGFLIGLGLALGALLYIHGIWLPSKGVNGWTAEPREKYYQLRGWPPPNKSA